MKSKLRVAIIGTTGLPARYGGFETLAHHLVDHLGDDMDMTVYCSKKYFAKSKKRLSVFNGAKLVYLPFNANGYQSIIYDMFSMFHAIRRSDVLLMLGISGAMMIPLIKLFSKKKILVNIDGQEWKRPKWNWLAKKILGFSERIAVRFADVLITDNKIIQQYVQESYGRSDAWLIEYGGDHVSTQNMNNTHIELHPFLSKPYAFNVCRIEPENNVHMILDAFSRAPQHTLVMVGLWSHGKYGIELKQKYSNYSNIHLLDPIYDQDHLNVLRSNAKVYVHGHSAGGTNPSLVEAMCLGLPVLSFGIEYNRETTNHRARYFSNAAELLKQLQALEEKECKRMGAELQQYGLQKYNWSRISGLYAAALRSESKTSADLTFSVSKNEINTIEIRSQKPKSIAA